jgi:osmotically inducible protein OsmC
MALSNTLAQAGHAPEKLDVEAVATFVKLDAGWRLTTMALSVTGSVPGMSAEQFVEAAAAAKDGCPVSNALKGNVEITAEATLV